LIFRTDWLKDKELIVGADYEGLNVKLIHPEVVSYELPWGSFQVDNRKFIISALQEPIIRAHDFFVRSFQLLPETPISAVGINREVHFSTPTEEAADRIGDTLAPKEFWGDFTNLDGNKVGGLRTMVMEQSIKKENRQARPDGNFGYTQVRVETSRRKDIKFGIFVQVNDHFDLRPNEDKLSDGRAVADLVSEKFVSSIKRSESLIDRIMELSLGS
jgi:hypothetical protein